MVSKSTFSCSLASLLLLLLCLLLTLNIASSDCRWAVGNRCFLKNPAAFQAFQTRKVLRAMKEMKVEADGGGRPPPAEWDELRRVPSGPDPLHHNGGGPKKPKTP